MLSWSGLEVLTDSRRSLICVSQTRVGLIALCPRELAPLDPQSGTRRVQRGCALLGPLVVVAHRADQFSMPAVNYRPASVLHLLGDEPLAAKRRSTTTADSLLGHCRCSIPLPSLQPGSFGGHPLEPERIGVRLGAFDGDPGVRPSLHQFVVYAAPWEPIPNDGFPRYPESSPAGAQSQ
jgi:hypothetical protein